MIDKCDPEVATWSDDGGNFVFIDQNNDGAITDADKTFIGKPFPDFTYGANLGLKWKGFDVNTFLYGSQGNDIYEHLRTFIHIGEHGLREDISLEKILPIE